MQIQKIHLATLGILLSLGLTACEKPTSAEKVGAEAGREIDQAAAKTQDKLNQAGAKISEQTAKTEAVIEDSAVTAKIKTALLAEPGIKGTDINVDTVSGVVTLSGIVDNAAQRDRVTEIARGVNGARQVDNRLVVRTPS